LDASQAAQIFIPGLLPFRDKQAIGDPFIKTPLVKFFGDGAVLVVKVIYVARLLVVDAEDGPRGFNYSLALMGFIFDYRIKERKT
jgi:hypothetical protein